MIIIGYDVTIVPESILFGTTSGAGKIIESENFIFYYHRLEKNTIVKSGTLVKQMSIFNDSEILDGFATKVI
jgi:carbonic anhydrase/acetyltransferase-like protein (isoleucine patch superfamily)